MSFVNFLASVILFIFSFWTVFKFVSFLSHHDHDHFALQKTVSGIRKSLLIDAGLILLFIMQHSGMIRGTTKQWMEKIFGSLQRSVFNGVTCIVIQLLMKFWEPVHGVTLWEVNTQESTFYWWLFTITHVIFWIIIYAQVIMMDFVELGGIKQTYYQLNRWSHPLNYKAHSLRRFLMHMRHPSLTGFTCVLLIHPVMRLDRVLLAVGLIAYILLGFDVDMQDYYYVSQQMAFKKGELKSRRYAGYSGT